RRGKNLDVAIRMVCGCQDYPDRPALQCETSAFSSNRPVEGVCTYRIVGITVVTDRQPGSLTSGWLSRRMSSFGARERRVGAPMPIARRRERQIHVTSRA